MNKPAVVPLDQIVVDTTDLVPFHRWRRVEERHGWTCYSPIGPGRPADICQGCGEFINDNDVFLVEQRLGERIETSDIYLTLVLAFRRARARAGLPIGGGDSHDTIE